MFRKKIIVPVEVSARHCHLSEEDLSKLFGSGYKLRLAKQLNQPTDFACKETITIEFGSKKIDKVRIVGPTRKQTQVEISFTDAISSGIIPPVRLSGDLKGSVAVILKGPSGSVKLKKGLIIARRHLHCGVDEAKKIDLRAGQIISIEIKGDRAITFHCVEVRVKDDYKLCLHLDADEGNAAGINKVGQGTVSIFKAKKE